MSNCKEIKQSFGSAHWEIIEYPLRYSSVENADDPVLKLASDEWVERTGSA